MLTLSIRQPWAYLVVNSHKDIENRTWTCEYRGSILIHASKSQVKQEYEAAEQFIGDRQLGILIPPLEHLPIGGIVGIADLIGITTDSNSPWAIAGQHHWQIEHARALDFHPCKGQQGLFPAQHPQISRLDAVGRSLGYGTCHQCSSPIRIPGAESFECPKCGWLPRPRAHVLGEVRA